MGLDGLPRFGIDESAAARGDHAVILAQEPGDDARLAGPEFGLAVGGEDIGDRHAGGGFDFGVGIGEGQSQARRQPPPDGGLARAHHAHEHDGSPGQALEHLAFGFRLGDIRRVVPHCLPFRSAGSSL